jgi:Tfp pilus assembly protein PilV
MVRIPLPSRSVRKAPGARGRARARGAGLVEVIVSTLLLSLVALGLVEFFAKGRFWFDQEEDKRVATLLAQEAMERTLAAGYPAIQSWAEERTVSRLPYTLRVAVLEDVPEPQIKTIRATVQWTAAAGAPRSVSLATLAYDH